MSIIVLNLLSKSWRYNIPMGKKVYLLCIEVEIQMNRWKFLKVLSTLLFADVAGGLVFGIPLLQCIENDRIARIAAGEAIADVGCLSRSSRHGSRASFSSLIETPTTVTAKTEEVRNR